MDPDIRNQTLVYHLAGRQREITTIDGETRFLRQGSPLLLDNMLQTTDYAVARTGS